ncbi:MAG TPA: peptide chain release factor N(5)-glutamine methyltransferase [Candidatus Dormibacteraeota bacterium]
MKLIEVLRRATGYLEEHGSTSPRLDAEVLMTHALGLRRIELYLQFERDLADAELQPYRDLLSRRGRGEPVAYLVGYREFMKLDFLVTPDVLVPNPDTETLVVRAIELGRGGKTRVADVGTGSGNIACAIAHYVPAAGVCAGDISEAALEVARQNAERLGVGERVRFAVSDLLEEMPGPFDLVCANLPYLPSWTDLPAEVRAQPPGALFGGEEGSEVVRRLLENAPERLAPGGVVLAEADTAVFEALRALVVERFVGHRIHRDLGGHERVLEAWTS